MIALLATLVPAAVLSGHIVLVDEDNKILAWRAPQSHAYAEEARSDWEYLKRVPNEPNGMPTYMSYPIFDPVTGAANPIGSVHHPSAVFAALTDAAIRYYRFSGDQEVIALVQRMLDHMIDHGLTAPNILWSRVPFASSEPGSLEYEGFAWEGIGGIESDKVGEMGVAFEQLYEFTGDAKYLRAALDCADALAKNVRTPDRDHPPWPFRLKADTGEIVEEYTSNVIGSIQLFDALIRLGEGDGEKYAATRQIAWDWLMQYPMQNFVWQGYFEDVWPQPPGMNLTQYDALETARYLLLNPDLDPDWDAHVRAIIDWTERTFGVDATGQPGMQFGARTISEQFVDMNKMGSHTSRYAGVNALYFARTGDEAAKEKAYRSLNWAQYTCNDNGACSAGVDGICNFWFGEYGDHIRFALSAMAAVPEWTPPGEAHVLDSTSTVTEVHLETAGELRYSTFQGSSDLVHVPFRPQQVTTDGGKALKTYSVSALDRGDFVVRVEHPDTTSVTLSATKPRPKGCEATGSAWLLALVSLLALRLFARHRRQP